MTSPYLIVGIVCGIAGAGIAILLSETVIFLLNKIYGDGRDER